MNDLQARNSLFEHGSALGLNWTVGETAEATSVIYLPVKAAPSMRASLYPFAHNWMLSWTTPVAGTEIIKVDKMNRDNDTLLRSLAAALQLVIDRTFNADPESALATVGFLGALGIATDNDAALEAATAGRARAHALIAERA